MILRVSSLQVISHPIIVLIFPKSFMLKSFLSGSLSHSNAFRFFDLRIKSAIYTPMIISSSFHLRIIIYVLALVEVKPIFWKILVIILFQSFSIYFRPFKFFTILQTSLFQPAKHFCEILI